jgi:hypothetical protein
MREVVLINIRIKVRALKIFSHSAKTFANTCRSELIRRNITSVLHEK